MIQIDNLNFSYKKEPLFQNINLGLNPGHIYGLLGLNGAGKSTFLRLIAGLQFPNGGMVNVLNSEPAKRHPSFLSQLFVLPESVVIPAVTDKEYINIRSPFYTDFDTVHMDRCLSEFEVPRGRKLNTLSHGQQKKFLLSFGLACRSKLLMLDEPTNGLDIPSKGIFRRLVAESFTEDQTFIISTHQIHDLQSLIDSIVVLHQGNVLFKQSIEDVSENLRMTVTNTKPDAEAGLLYSEQTIGGYANLWQDTDAPDGQINLELLFKAVIAKPGTYSNLFDKKISKEQFSEEQILEERNS